MPLRTTAPAPPGPGPLVLLPPGRSLPTALSVYAGSVGVLGAGLLLAVVLTAPPFAALAARPVPLVVLALALVLAELFPVPIYRPDGSTSTVTVSTTFAVALVVLGPLSFVLAVHTAAVAVDDVRSGRRPVQVLFNAGQYALALVAARTAYSAVSGAPLLGTSTVSTPMTLLAALVAGATFALVNQVLVCAVAAIATGTSLTDELADELRLTADISAVLVALGPVAALLVDASVLMLPLLVLPVLAVRRTTALAARRVQQSTHDPLTGLANRELFRRSADRALAARPRGVAVLLIDLDHFRDVNDTLGHEVGDEVLRVVADRLRAAAATAGDGAVVARLSGDEFAVLMVTEHPRVRAAEAAETVLAALSRPLDVQGSRLSVHASIGITTTDGGDLADGSAALRQADIALYEAKRERARATVFRPGLTSGAEERLRLLPELREAVETRQLAVLYQAQADAVTGEVVGVEALVRWDHPVRGRLSPDAFVALAESAGMIAPITTFVLEEALAAAAGWQRRGARVSVSVNLSARQLSDLGLPAHVARLLREAGVAASSLTVEVTENSLMSDPRAARSILSALREMGVHLAIDDFGTGYSSLVLLQQLAVDELKIDRSFVTDLEPGGHGEVLVRSIIELGHNLGLCVVAEGVETAEVAGLLRALGCDRLQGYLYSRPLEREAVDALLTAPTPPATHPPQPPGRR